jgi:hypothetical protein
MVAIFHHYAFNHARAPEFIAGTKVAAAEVSRRPISESFGYQRAFGYSALPIIWIFIPPALVDGHE